MVYIHSHVHVLFFFFTYYNLHQNRNKLSTSWLKISVFVLQSTDNSLQKQILKARIFYKENLTNLDDPQGS